MSRASPVHIGNSAADRSNERGAAAVLIATAILLAAYLTLQVTRLSVAAADRARAQTAADAAALAGVVEGEDSAANFAQRNGAKLLSFIDDGDEVLVTVAYADARASARAERVDTSPFT